MAGICNLCGLPDELCICQEIAKEQQKAIISTVRRRYGKMVTMVEGIDDTAMDMSRAEMVAMRSMMSRIYLYSIRPASSLL